MLTLALLRATLSSRRDGIVAAYNLYTGAEYELTTAHLDEFLALRVTKLSDRGRYYLMVQTGDQVLDYRLAVAHYAGAWQLVLGGGDHAFADFERHLDSILQFAGIAVD